MKMKKLLVLLLPVYAIIGFVVLNAFKKAHYSVPPNDVNAGLTIPAGFSAVAVAEKIGNARHMVITPEKVSWFYI